MGAARWVLQAWASVGQKTRTSSCTTTTKDISALSRGCFSARRFRSLMASRRGDGMERGVLGAGVLGNAGGGQHKCNARTEPEAGGRPMGGRRLFGATRAHCASSLQQTAEPSTVTDSDHSATMGPAYKTDPFPAQWQWDPFPQVIQLAASPRKLSRCPTHENRAPEPGRHPRARAR